MKKVTVVLTLSVLLGLTVSAAQATETCYQLEPFSDILRFGTRNSGPLTPPGRRHTLIHGNWIALGVYTIPFTGSVELDVGSTTTKRLGIHGTNGDGGFPPTFFGGQPSCLLDGYPGGPWFISCSGGTSSPFVNSGNPLKLIPCGGQPPSSPGSGIAAGE